MTKATRVKDGLYTYRGVTITRMSSHWTIKAPRHITLEKKSWAEVEFSLRDSVKLIDLLYDQGDLVESNDTSNPTLTDKNNG